MDPLPRKAKETEEDKERERWEGPAVTFHLQRLTPPPEEILRLSKRLLIRRRVAGEGQIKNSFGGCSLGNLV